MFRGIRLLSSNLRVTQIKYIQTYINTVCMFNPLQCLKRLKVEMVLFIVTCHKYIMSVAIHIVGEYYEKHLEIVICITNPCDAFSSSFFVHVENI